MKYKLLPVFTILFVGALTPPAFAEFCVIRSWNEANQPNSVGRADTSIDAQNRVATLVNLGFTNAFYLDDASSLDGEECWRNPVYWTVDPVAKTASFNSAVALADYKVIAKSKAQREATKRESSGITIEGVFISTSPESVSRIGTLMLSAQRKEAASQPVSAAFRTKNGSRVVIASAADAEVIFDTASAHIEAVQAALDFIYNVIDGLTLDEMRSFNVKTWVGWP